MSQTGMKIFTGTSNKDLVTHVIRHLRRGKGSYRSIQQANAEIDRFSDGEVRVELLESVRGQTVYIVQSTCAPTNDNLMELLALADACRRSNAQSVVAVIPYFGYSRQDRRPDFARVPITSKLVARMIEAAGVDYVVTVDLHAAQIQGFFDIPSLNISAAPVITSDVFAKFGTDNVIVVSPDVGGVARARNIAKQLNDCDLAIIDKRRPKANVSEVMNIIGEVSGKNCVLVDDIVDTGGTLCKAAAALKQAGALSVVAYCTHPVLSGAAVDNITNSVLDELVVTDTIPLDDRAAACPKIRVYSIGELLAETIRRLHDDSSISEMYM